MEAFGTPLLCCDDRYYTAIGGNEYELKYGNLIIELSNIDIFEIKKTILTCPYYNEILSPGCKDLTKVYTWLEQQLLNIATPIISSILLNDITDLVRDFFDGRNVFYGQRDDDVDSYDATIKNFIFEDTDFDDYGFDTIGHLLLSSLRAIVFGVSICNGILRNLSEGKKDFVLSSISEGAWGNIAVPCQFRFLFGEIHPVYVVDNLVSASLVELSKITEKGITIKACQNCGKYFIPENRTDEIYCNRNSPQNTQMTCKEYGTKKLWYEKTKSDEVAKLSRNIYMAKQMLVRRNPDIAAYAEMFDYFKKERKRWEADVKSGKKSRDEYIEWLKGMKSRKVM